MLIVAFLLLASCSQEPPFTPLHSCELLTTSEMAALIGAAIDEPARETHREDAEEGQWMSMCNYYAPDPGISTGLMVQPFALGLSSSRQAREAYEQSLATKLPDHMMVSDSNGGGEATWNEEIGQLTVFRDGHMFLITVMIKDGSGEDKLALARKIAMVLGGKQLPVR